MTVVAAVGGIASRPSSRCLVAAAVSLPSYYTGTTAALYRCSSWLHTAPLAGQRQPVALSPAVLHNVRTLNLDPSLITATGPKGNLLKGDILKHHKQHVQEHPSSPSPSLSIPPSLSPSIPPSLSPSIPPSLSPAIPPASSHGNDRGAQPAAATPSLLGSAKGTLPAVSPVASTISPQRITQIAAFLRTLQRDAISGSGISPASFTIRAALAAMEHATPQRFGPVTICTLEGELELSSPFASLYEINAALTSKTASTASSGKGSNAGKVALRVFTNGREPTTTASNSSINAAAIHVKSNHIGTDNGSPIDIVFWDESLNGQSAGRLLTRLDQIISDPIAMLL